MIKRTGIVLEGKWADYMKAHKEKRESCDSPIMEINGYRNKMFFYNYGLYHIWASTGEAKYDIILLDVINNRFPIVVVICFDGCEEVEMFDTYGNSRSGKYVLEIESVHFEKGDYVKTDTGAIGILSHGDWMQCGIWETGEEFAQSCCNGIPVELCNDEEIKLLDELLFVNDLKLNSETKIVEKV